MVAYAVLKEKINNPMKYPLAILNRFLRFIPAYFVAIMIYYTIFPHLGSGPSWKPSLAGVPACDHMWRSLLFVDNLIDNGASQCLGWGWYLQNDMQIFIYSIFILLIYRWNKFASYVTIVWSIAASFIFSMVSTYVNGYHHPTHIDDFNTWNVYMVDVYIKPWARCPPYLYGLLLGMMYTNFL